MQLLTLFGDNPHTVIPFLFIEYTRSDVANDIYNMGMQISSKHLTTQGGKQNKDNDTDIKGVYVCLCVCVHACVHVCVCMCVWVNRCVCVCTFLFYFWL